eukprot:scaffold383572_cov34-Prasinocladus_malaysianus.AAC.1
MPGCNSESTIDCWVSTPTLQPNVQRNSAAQPSPDLPCQTQASPARPVHAPPSTARYIPTSAPPIPASPPCAYRIALSPAALPSLPQANQG